MPSGPSKEQLEVYWTSSRQYFDELAKHYQSADPAYYKEYILPFYSNPFRSGTGQKSSAGPKIAIFAAMAVVVLIGAAAAVLFVFIGSSSTEDKPKVKERKVETTDEGKVKENTVPKTEEEDMKDVFPSDDFLLGSKYLAQKDYDKAEEHFKKVKPGDKNYEQAQQLLKNMKLLRKYDK